MASAPTDLELLELDIDLRIHAVMLEASSHDAWDEELWALLRLAYGAGYCAALTEARRGQLCLDHGFPVPERQRC